MFCYKKAWNIKWLLLETLNQAKRFALQNQCTPPPFKSFPFTNKTCSFQLKLHTFCPCPSLISQDPHRTIFPILSSVLNSFSCQRLFFPSTSFCRLSIHVAKQMPASIGVRLRTNWAWQGVEMPRCKWRVSQLKSTVHQCPYTHQKQTLLDWFNLI